MVGARGFELQGRKAMLVSMHGKDRAIAPPLRRRLALTVETLVGVDTDRFGTFTGEIERQGSPMDAARAKIAAGFELAPQCSVMIASEGSFGPHPEMPFVAAGRELVVLFDRETNIELVGRDYSFAPSFRQATVYSGSDAMKFATSVGFPAQGIVVLASVDGAPAPRVFTHKSAASFTDLVTAVVRALNHSGEAHLACDMRAHRNPQRMAAIRRAATDLVRSCLSRCPRCDRPGFRATETILGAACRWCGSPTRQALAEVSICCGCDYRVERSLTNSADPGTCGFCNP